MTTSAKDKKEIGRFGREFTERARTKIRVMDILYNLQRHIAGEIEMKSTQVRACEILLRKCMPDLQATQLTGSEDGPLIVELVKFSEGKDDDASK